MQKNQIPPAPVIFSSLAFVPRMGYFVEGGVFCFLSLIGKELR